MGVGEDQVIVTLPSRPLEVALQFDREVVRHWD